MINFLFKYSISFILYSKPLGNHTLKIMKKIWKFTKKKPGKIMVVSPKKWEP